ncbi:Plasmodium exported protein, unknown function [Plasmodium sp.]|nr:Plasmodium exported protein, unknown function [Plasmodium sp.]
MLFLSFKLFLFIVVLNIILVFERNIKIVNIYERIKNYKKFQQRFHKSLAEHIKYEKGNYESKEFDLLYEELVKQKLKNYKILMDLRKKENNYKKKKLRDKKWQDKVVRSKIRAYYLLIGEYNKYYEMRDSFNLIEIKNKIKNKLYEIIFKGRSFWKRLGFFLELLGICAAQYNIFVIVSSLVYFLAYIDPTSFLSTFLIVFSGIYGVLILLIIITVVVVVLLLVWLWPNEEKK